MTILSRNQILEFAGYGPDSAAEMMRVNMLMNQYVKQHGTLDGFEEFLAEFDALETAGITA